MSSFSLPARRQAFLGTPRRAVLASALFGLASCDNPVSPERTAILRAASRTDVAAALSLGLDTSQYWFSGIVERRVELATDGAPALASLKVASATAGAPSLPPIRRRELRRLTSGRTATGEARTEVLIYVDSTSVNDRPAAPHDKSQLARMLVQAGEVSVFGVTGALINRSRIGSSTGLSLQAMTRQLPDDAGFVTGGIATTTEKLTARVRAGGGRLTQRGREVVVERDVGPALASEPRSTARRVVEEFDEQDDGRLLLRAFQEVSVSATGTRLSTVVRLLSRSEGHVADAWSTVPLPLRSGRRPRPLPPMQVVRPSPIDRVASALGACDQPASAGSAASVQLIFVHGIWSDCGTWSTLIDRTTSTYSAAAYGISTPTMAGLGLQASMVDAARASAGDALGKPRILIGHSQGGLIAREAYRMSHPAFAPAGYSRPAIAGILTIDTPHSGADINVLGRFLAPWLAELGFVVAADRCIHWESGFGGGGGPPEVPPDQYLSIEDFANGNWYASASCFAVTALAPLAFQTFFDVWPISQSGTPLGAMGDNYPGAPFIETLNYSPEPVARAAITNVIPLPGSALRMMYEMLFKQDGAFIQMEAQAQAEYAQLMQWNAWRVANLMGTGISAEQEEIVGFWTGMVNFFLVVDIAWAAVTNTVFEGGDGFIRRGSQHYVGEGSNPRNEEVILQTSTGRPANSHIWATKGDATWQVGQRILEEHFGLIRR